MRRKGFTLIELLTIIAIVAILIAIIFPAFARHESMARQVTCQSNLKQLALAINMYEQDWNDTMPPSFHGSEKAGYTMWTHYILPYARNIGIFTCPCDIATVDNRDKPDGQSWVEVSYHLSNYISAPYGIPKWDDTGDMKYLGIPYRTATKSQLEHPADIFMIWCGGDLACSTDNNLPNYHMMRVDVLNGFPNPRHNGGTNYAFCDGHVKWLPQKAVPDTDPRFFIH